MGSTICVGLQHPCCDGVVVVLLEIGELHARRRRASRREQLLHLALPRPREDVRERVELNQVPLTTDDLTAIDLIAARAALKRETRPEVATATEKPLVIRRVLDLDKCLQSFVVLRRPLCS